MSDNDMIRYRTDYTPSLPRYRIDTRLLSIAVCAPAFLLAVIIAQNWVNIPHMDQWGISRIFDNYFDRGLSVKDLIAQHNESRKVFPRLIILGLGLLSRWDVRWEMCFTFILACLLSCTFYLHLRKSTRLTANRALAICVLLNFFLFSPSHRNNWFMGLQFCVFLPPLMLSLGLLVNTSHLPTWSKILINIPCAVIGTFSFANGMILWLLLIPPDLLKRNPFHRYGRVKAALATYSACILTVMVLYFRDYVRPVQSTPMSEAFLHPLEVFRFLLIWLSTPIPAFESLVLQAWIGGIILVLFICFSLSSVMKRMDYHAVYPWITMGLYSLISGVSASLGRIGFGYDMALSSRYATPALFMTTGVLVLSVITWYNPSYSTLPFSRARFCIRGLVLLFFVTLHCKAYLPELHHIDQLKLRLIRGKIALRLIDVFPDNRKMSCIHTNREFLKQRFRKITQYGLLDFRPLAPGLLTIGKNSSNLIDTTIGRFERVDRLAKQRFRVEGWIRARPGPIMNYAVVFFVTDSRGNSKPVDFLTFEEKPIYAEIQSESSKIWIFKGILSTTSFPPGSESMTARLVDFDSRTISGLDGCHFI